MDIQPEVSPLEMGFNTDPVDDVPYIVNHFNTVEPEVIPLDMGFETNPGYDVPDQSRRSSPLIRYYIIDHFNSVAVGQPEPIGFVIERAVGDLRMAIQQLEFDQADETISPEEAFVRQQVLECTQELLLACQLISIP